MTSATTANMWDVYCREAVARFTAAHPLCLGGRGSEMSRRQLEEAARRIRRMIPGISVAVVPIKVGADLASDRPAIEGKGVYTDNINTELLAGHIHAAVHCEKDLDSEPAEDSGIVDVARLERGKVADALVSRGRVKFVNLRAGSHVGTSSPRRTAQMRRERQDLVYLPVKGNIDTRIQRMNAGDGDLDALVVSWEGLGRLDMWDAATEVFDLNRIAPPAGAAIVTVQARTDDLLVRRILRQLNHKATDTAAVCERAMLVGLGGNCASAVSGYAVVDDATGEITLTGKVFAPAGDRDPLSVTASGREPRMVGQTVAGRLNAVGAAELLGSSQ